MNQRAIIMAIVLFVLVVIGMFVFTYLKQQEIKEETAAVQQVEPAVVDAYSDITRINGKHFFIDGVHTVVGEVSLPTPCDLLGTSSSVTESAPDQITIDFSVINNAETCAQIVTDQRFKVSAAGNEEAAIHAHFQGRDVILNLVDALPGETPEEFELFIKG